MFNRRSALLAAWILALGAGSVRAQHLGHVLLGVQPSERLGTALLVIPDIDGDGLAEIVVGGVDVVRLFAGGTGDLLRTWAAPQVGDDFGAALALLDDLDADGWPELAIGAPQVANGGAGYVVVTSPLSGAILLTINGSLVGDRFGAALGAAGDLDLDGVGDLLIGAPGASTPGFDAGRVDARRVTDGSLLHQVAGATTNAGLGAAITAGFDFDQDGVPDYAVGAPGGNPPPGVLVGGTGAVLLISGASGAVLTTLPGDGLGDGFGAAIAAVSDLDGDGRAEIAVGAPEDDDGGSAAGSVRVFIGAQPFLPIATHHGPAANERFGAALADAADQSGDGLADLLVGAPFAASSGSVRVVDSFLGIVHDSWAGDAVLEQHGVVVATYPDVDGDLRPELLATAPAGPTLVQPRGRVRLRSAAPFLGSLAHGSSLSNLLTVNGSDGGVAHRVDLTIAQPVIVNLTSPAGPSPFLVFGAVGVPAVTMSFTLPFGLGRAVLPPCDLAPSLAPALFYLAASPGVGGCVSFATAPSTPLALAISTGLAQPLTTTLQAVVLDASAQPVLTNAIVVRIL